MSSTTTHRTLLDTVRRGPERFSESVAPIWRLHVLLILACGIGVGSVWVLDRPERPTLITIAALMVEAVVFAATIRALRRGSATDRWWPYVVCTVLSALTAVPGYFFGPNSGFAGVVAHVLVLARLFTGGWGVRSSRALAWTIYGSLVGAQAVAVGLVLGGVLPDVSLVPLVAEGSTPWRAALSHVAIQGVWFGAFLLGRLLQRTYGDLAARADDEHRAALRREALLQEARAEYERALLAGTQGVFSGHVFGGYQLGELLGRGGMGEIYDAVNESSGRRAAVKLLRGDQLRSRGVIESFLREAEVLRRVDSPYVARVYDAGGMDTAVPYIAMEHLGGRDLGSMLRSGGPLESRLLRRLARDVAAGLDAVHACGIVHGDLSPRNIVLSTEGSDGIWKLVDFGLASAPEDAAAGRTPPAGTLPYVAPERLRGQVPDARSDVYGLAAVLYAAVTGRPPFEPRGAAPTIAAVLEQMPPSPVELVGALADVAAVLRVGLAKDPAMRFPDAGALGDAMLAALDGRLDDSARAYAEQLEGRIPWGDSDDAPTAFAVRPARNGTGAISELSERAPRPFSGGDAATAWASPRARRMSTPNPALERTAIAMDLDEETATDVDVRPSFDAGAPWGGDGGVRVPEPTQPQSSPAAAGLGPGVVVAEPAPRPRVTTAAFADTVEASPLVADVWQGALRSKTVPVMLGFLGMCAAGILLVAGMARHDAPMYAAIGGIAGIAAITGIQLRRVLGGATPVQLNWPWAIVAVLCVGPAYFFGLTGGFAALLAVGLFSNGGLTAGQRNPLAIAIPIAVLGSQGAMLALILSGVAPDEGLSRVVSHADAPLWEPVFAFALVQGIYMSAHVAGFLVDRKHSHLLAAAIRASREAAEQRAMLSAARAQLRRALSGDEGGVFSGHRVGDYELAMFIGRGGMGEVYDATHIATGARAAVKLIRADRFGDAQAVRLFVREAAVLSRIHSPHVAQVYAAGGGDGEIPYIAMEMLEGRALSDLLRDRDALEAAQLSALIADIGSGLQAVHAAGIVHRDLKPQNIMLVRAEQPRWKLLDFGIAKLLDRGGDATTRNLVLGTPPYMAPEHILGRPVDARTDLYSFGLVIYRALVGRPAYAAPDPVGVLDAAREHGPPDPRDYVGMSADVEYALRIAIAYDPADRFASADEMKRAFAAAFDESLDSALRRRGRDLLARAPWARRR